MGLTALWWWIDRWRKSTAYMDMTLAEQGAYRNLLDEAHLRGGPLPLDERILAKACGDALAWPEVRIAVLARFERDADGWHNLTLESVLHESKRRAELQAEKGRIRAASAARDSGRFAGSSPAEPAELPASRQPHQQPPPQPPSPSPSPISGSVSDSKIKTVSSASENPTTEPAEMLVFPVTGPGPKTWTLTTVLLTEWADAYPAIDVLVEVHKALVWIRANRRKTARGMPRFLVAWLNRATNADTFTRQPIAPSSDTHETRHHPAGQRPRPDAFDADWSNECQRTHAGACEGDRIRHYLRRHTEQMKTHG
jgi:uncharacterized protein YdaU (DUF1376 family)